MEWHSSGDCTKRAAYKMTYFSVFLPVPDDVPLSGGIDRMVLPPKTMRPAGRPKKQRIRIEKTFNRAYFYKRCGANVHNKRSCKEPIDDCIPSIFEQATEQGNDFPGTPEEERDFFGSLG
ncbi:hypothetical protein AMTR_s00012p00239780 [Amborella trichopoda]|uniref:Zinc knuckle CX2CX4HX4C domain-containing protein n=1 Tax=Amborella trichopoda TaxID=13333 RepID=W1PDB4_AMBTC|nr:hypothetical protein AMTR_s00012p00239780 [Amborella trichopoda]